MKAFLINLDRSPERLRRFREQATACGIDFERIPAIDGRMLNAKALSEAVRPEYTFQPINAGEAALFMTHRLCWQSLLESGSTFAAVFEDDVVLGTQTGEVLAQIRTRAPAFDVIKLETTLRRVVVARKGIELMPDLSLHALLSWHGGTAAYVLSCHGARKLLSATLPIADPVDQAMFNPLSPASAGLSIAQLVPAIAVQYDILKPGDDCALGSTIGRRMGRGRLFRHGPLIDLKRAVKKYLERRRRHALARRAENQLMVVGFDSGKADE